MKHHSIKSAPGSIKKAKRVGRGGKRGTYAGRGGKGQTARTGGNIQPGFEGGQTPLIRRMPKLKGFKNPNRVPFFAVNVDRLELFDDGSTVDLKALMEKGIVKRATKVKLLATGELTKKLTVHVNAASKDAVKKVEQAGGKVVLPS
ncbi:MAG: 50S ribosomal protein L15 [Patescibacteria group bacterium]